MPDPSIDPIELLARRIRKLTKDWSKSDEPDVDLAHFIAQGMVDLRDTEMAKHAGELADYVTYHFPGWAGRNVDDVKRLRTWVGEKKP